MVFFTLSVSTDTFSSSKLFLPFSSRFLESCMKERRRKQGRRRRRAFQKIEGEKWRAREEKQSSFLLLLLPLPPAINHQKLPTFQSSSSLLLLLLWLREAGWLEGERGRENFLMLSSFSSPPPPPPPLIPAMRGTDGPPTPAPSSFTRPPPRVFSTPKSFFQSSPLLLLLPPNFFEAPSLLCHRTIVPSYLQKKEKKAEFSVITKKMKKCIFKERVVRSSMTLR